MIASDTPDALAPGAGHSGNAAIRLLARELLADIEAGGVGVMPLLMKGARLARIVGVPRMERWLDCELRGYDMDDGEADALMAHARRWKNETERVGYLEPLPAIETRITGLERHARTLEPTPLPPLPPQADSRLVAMHAALVERTTARLTEERRRVQGQLADLNAIRSSVLALLHAFADRMLAEHPVPAQPIAPPITPGEDDDMALIEPDPFFASQLDDDFDEAEPARQGLPANETEVWDDAERIAVAPDDSDADDLPEAMLTDDDALDAVDTALGRLSNPVDHEAAEVWQEVLEQDVTAIETMSAEELADMLDTVLGPSTPAERETAPSLVTEPPAGTAAEDAADPYDALRTELMALRTAMAEADAQEAADAALHCGRIMTRFASLLGEADAGPDAEAQVMLSAAIRHRTGDTPAVEAFDARVAVLFAHLIEVEIGGDAEHMEQLCNEALNLMDDMLHH